MFYNEKTTFTHIDDANRCWEKYNRWMMNVEKNYNWAE